ncbi:MAG: rod shape-determining protein RodA [Paludibacter sp.]|nr:rod shape-determining protein RodA [Paludibacter sp.]MDD4198100.1 rod shape-determining protein RodA [Paludibacter sp.]MDD4427682.1 rod shape-determining protein RodA [Paludibacter sp.]
MSKRDSIQYAPDWTTVFYFFLLVTMGWISIYGASYDFEFEGSIFDFEQRAGKQFIWILTAFALGGAILLLDHRIFNYFAYIIYTTVILLLIVTIFIAPEIKGSRSWLVLGPVSFQPAELAKMATALALAKFMSRYNFKIKTWRDLIPLAFFIMLPFVLIILQKETGSALVFAAFLLMLYREGMKGIVLLLVTLAVVLFVVVIRFSISPITEGGGTWGMVLAMGILLLIQVVYAFFYTRHRKEALILLSGTTLFAFTSVVMNKWFVINYDYVALAIAGASGIYWLFIELFKRYRKYLLLALVTIVSIGFSYTADQLFNRILEPHQQVRIKVLLNMEDDPAGAGYNVNQSKIAIGSGGFFGKGFLNGTQTKLKYVPEQDTDFIFCTVGEEHGFLGSVFVLIIYWLLLMRILKIAERQRESFHRIYAYCVASILFFHLMINVGMVLGLMPVIGIPLPFFSYGGSSLWGFTIMLFILLRMDASRLERGR